MTDAPTTPDEVVKGSAVEALGVDLPDHPEAAVEELAGMVISAENLATTTLDDLKRLAADFENFRKRAERDRSDMVAMAARDVALAILPVLDGLDAAAAAGAETPGEQRLLDGLLSTRDQLLAVLAAEGVTPVAIGPNEPFDPSVHEAVSGGGSGHLVVTAELRRGYRLGDRLLRAAMVQVAAEDAAADEG